MVQVRDNSIEGRMLTAGLEALQEHHLGANVWTLGFEEVIRAADVPRTSAYRRWPNKDEYFADLLLELARGTNLPIQDSLDTGGLGDDLQLDTAMLADAGYRHELVVGVLRQACHQDFVRMHHSPEWQTHLALVGALDTIADEGLREQVRSELAASDRTLAQSRARVYQRFCGLFGYRLRSPHLAPNGFDLMSTAAGATMMGLLVSSFSNPDLANGVRTQRLFGTSRAAEWSTPAAVIAGVIWSYVEPDPGVIWDEARISDFLTAVTETFS